MWLDSLKFTLRGMFRDIVRGVPARLLIYPKLAANEYSEAAIIRYLKLIRVAHIVSVKTLPHVDDESGCVTKQQVRDNPSRFLRARTIKTLLRNTIRTSGTSGQPLELKQDYIGVLREEAFVYRQLRWAGYRWRDRRVWLRGDIISAPKGQRTFGKCYDWWSNTLYLSSYHISKDTAQAYLDSIESFNPILIQAYPSSIYAMAAWMLKSGIRFKGQALRSIVTSSESLTPEMQAAIESAFGARIFDWYGLAERVVAIGTCERGGRHVLTDYGLAELIARDGMYELVGTGYINSAMPFRRYRTGDFVKIDGKACDCGRVFPTVKQVLGRSDETIMLSDGRLIGRLDHVFKGAENVVQGQIAYRFPDEFVLRIVPGPRWTSFDEGLVLSNFKERLSGVNVTVELVLAIPRGANGKVKFIVCEKQQ